MVTIRAAVAEDLETVRLLLREYLAYLNESVGAEHISQENFEKELGTLPVPYDVMLLALVDDVPAGIVALKPLQPMRAQALKIGALSAAFAEERASELKRLWVRPEFRGLRIGQKLTARLIEEARVRGYTAMYLDTMPEIMGAAHRIYLELGFSAVEKYTENAVLKAVPGCEDNHAPGVVFLRREI